MGNAERAWLLLVGPTFGGAWLGEAGESGWALALLVGVLIAVKGRVVIETYMEMKGADTRLLRLLHLFVTLVPAMVPLSHGWSEVLRRLTTLG